MLVKGLLMSGDGPVTTPVNLDAPDLRHLTTPTAYTHITSLAVSSPMVALLDGDDEASIVLRSGCLIAQLPSGAEEVIAGVCTDAPSALPTAQPTTHPTLDPTGGSRTVALNLVFPDSTVTSSLSRWGVADQAMSVTGVEPDQILCAGTGGKASMQLVGNFRVTYDIGGFNHADYAWTLSGLVPVTEKAACGTLAGRASVYVAGPTTFSMTHDGRRGYDVGAPFETEGLCPGGAGCFAGISMSVASSAAGTVRSVAGCTTGTTTCSMYPTAIKWERVNSTISLFTKDATSPSAWSLLYRFVDYPNDSAMEVGPLGGTGGHAQTWSNFQWATGI
jgi:hypothetical protein